jgi:heptosyltransferase-1
MRIAIVKLSALGDIIHAMAVLQYIKNFDTGIVIDWFVEERFAEVLENNPDIDTIHSLKLKNNKLGILQEYKKLKRLKPYDLVIDLQGLIKSALVSKVLGKNIVGFDKHSLREPLASLFYTQKYTISYDENVIVRNIKLVAKALDFPIADLKEKVPFLYTTSKIDIFPTLLIIVGSSWESKVYPKESFIEIIKALHVKTFISWGNEKEKLDADFICKQTKATLLPKLSLNELKKVVSNSSLVIGADSGPTHMAWGLNIPSITIYGPTPSKRNTYITSRNLVVDCGKPLNAKEIDKQNMCIKTINPASIITKAKELLAC